MGQLDVLLLALDFVLLALGVGAALLGLGALALGLEALGFQLGFWRSSRRFCWSISSVRARDLALEQRLLAPQAAQARSGRPA